MSNRPNRLQLEALVEFLEQNPGIATGVLRTINDKLESRRKWAKLSVSLNALGAISKDGRGWAKYWAERKCALKKLCIQTTEELCTLSPLNKRLVAVMAEGGLPTVNPFQQAHYISSTELSDVPDQKDAPPPIPTLATATNDSATSVPNSRLHCRGRLPPRKIENKTDIHETDHVKEDNGDMNGTEHIRETQGEMVGTERKDQGDIMDGTGYIKEENGDDRRTAAQQISSGLDRLCNSIDNVATAITSVATALQRIADSLNS